MTIRNEPYYENDRWNVDKDPDPKQTFVIDVTDEMRKNGLTALSVIPIPYRMEVTKGPTLEFDEGRTYVKVQVRGPLPETPELADDAHVTLRVTGDGDGDECDCTVFFNPVRR